jgi:hypothetical protein
MVGVLYHILGASFAFIRFAIFMHMAIYKEEAFVSLFFVDKMGPKVTFIN